MNGHQAHQSMVAGLPQGFNPVFGVKGERGVSDINAIGMAAKEEWRFLSLGHGGVRQLLTGTM